MEYAMDGFFDWLSERCGRRDDYAGAGSARLAAMRSERALALSERMGLKRLRSFGETGSLSKKKTEDEDGVERIEYALAYLPGMIGPLHVYSPLDAEARLKAEARVILYCPGHEDRHEAFHDEDWRPPFKENPRSLALAGFTVAVPTFAGFVDMALEEYKQPVLAGCYAIASRLYLYGISLAALRVYQLERIRDLLGHMYRKAAFGLYGMSGGGEIAAYAHALLPGFAATMVAGYASQYVRSIMAMEHCLCNYAIGVLSEVGECSRLLALGAPRPLFISSGERDPIFPVEGARECYEDLRGLYSLSGAQDKLRFELHRGAHEPSYSFQRQWFEEWLR
jgi:hypothetical protein